MEELTLQERIMRLEGLTRQEIIVEPFLDGWILFSLGGKIPIFADVTGDTPLECVDKAWALINDGKV